MSTDQPPSIPAVKKTYALSPTSSTPAAAGSNTLRAGSVKPSESQLIKTLESSLASLEEGGGGGVGAQEPSQQRDFLRSILVNKFENWLFPGLQNLNLKECDSCCGHPTNNAFYAMRNDGSDSAITIPKKDELMTLFYAPDPKTWSKWKMTVVGKGSGEISSAWDELIQSQVLRIVGNPKGLVYIATPISPKKALHIKLPFLNMTLRHFNAYFSMEIEILDHKNEKRTFQICNFKSLVRISSHNCSMPMRLHRGWNHVFINLPMYVHDAFGTRYVETLRVKINSNIYIRRIYFSAKEFDEITLPAEYKIFPNTLLVNSRNARVPKFRRRCKGEEEMILLEDMAVPSGTIILETNSTINNNGDSCESHVHKKYGGWKRRLVEPASSLIPVEDDEEWERLIHGERKPSSASETSQESQGHIEVPVDLLENKPSTRQAQQQQHQKPVLHHLSPVNTPATTILTSTVDDSTKADTASSDSLKVFTSKSQNEHELNDNNMGGRNGRIFQRKSTVIYLNSKRLVGSPGSFTGGERDKGEGGGLSRKASLSSTHSCPSANITRRLVSKPSFGCILTPSSSSSSNTTHFSNYSKNCRHNLGKLVQATKMESEKKKQKSVKSVLLKEKTRISKAGDAHKLSH